MLVDCFDNWIHWLPRPFARVIGILEPVLDLIEIRVIHPIVKRGPWGQIYTCNNLVLSASIIFFDLGSFSNRLPNRRAAWATAPYSIPPTCCPNSPSFRRPTCRPSQHAASLPQSPVAERSDLGIVPFHFTPIIGRLMIHPCRHQALARSTGIAGMRLLVASVNSSPSHKPQHCPRHASPASKLLTFAHWRSLGGP